MKIEYALYNIKLNIYINYIILIPKPVNHSATFIDANISLYQIFSPY